MGSVQASLVREEGNMLALGKRENAARWGLRTQEEKGGDHFYFWSKVLKVKVIPIYLHLYILWFLLLSSVLDEGSVDPKVLAISNSELQPLHCIQKRTIEIIKYIEYFKYQNISNILELKILQLIG